MNQHQQTIATQLRDHLDHELAVHRRLFALAEEKQRRIVAHEIPAFTQLLEQEQGVITEAGRLRLVRDRLVRAVATIMALKPEATTLTTVLERLDGSLRDQLAERQRELRSLLERLRQLNERNLLLIRSGIGLVRDILQSVIGNGEVRNYDRRGNHGQLTTGAGQLVNLAG
jgi:flagellar biosynthesis/type III secretory pathway chaperone